MTPPPPTTLEPMPCGPTEILCPLCAAPLTREGLQEDDDPPYVLVCENPECILENMAVTEARMLKFCRPTPQPTREAASWNPSYADIEALTAFVLSIDEHSSAIRNNMPFAVIEVKRDRVFIAASIAYPAIKRALAAAPKPEPTAPAEDNK